MNVYQQLPLLLFALLLFYAFVPTSEATDSITSADLPVEPRDVDSSASLEEDLISTSYVLPNQIFNDGKPYYASKDPISGQPDFSAKKPAGIETAANEVFDPKEKIVLSNSSPNIHDYLNLPVKYSSSKFVYPLVSSSYANLKYQGSNKNYMTNKKPTSLVVPATPPPAYQVQSNNRSHYTVPTTKLMAVQPTAAGFYTTSVNITSKKPEATTSTTSTSTTMATPTPTTTATTRTTTTTTTASPSTTFKYTTASGGPTVITTTTSAPRVSTTRKKFIPSKKYSSTTTTTTTVGSTSTPIRFPTQPALSSLSTTPATTPPTTTRQPVSHSSQYGTNINSTDTHALPNTAHPVVFTESPSPQPSFSPLPSNTPRMPPLDPADVYQTLGQKYNKQKIEQKPSMTLDDIFNSLAEEEFAVASQNQGSQGFDAQGNLIEPISLSRPSPFAAHESRPQVMAQSNTPVTTSISSQHQQQQQPHQQQNSPTIAIQQQQLYSLPIATQQQQQIQQHQQQQMGPNQPQQQLHQPQQVGQNEQKVISGSQENYSNEYVSYQVQQPNVMQYRPMPGAINNVVISPGQNSATFVLGSQQQVGTNAIGSVEKEALFSKEPPVQYGTVISEDISSLQRVPGTSLSQGPNPLQQANSNFQPSGNMAHQVTHGTESQLTQQRPGLVGSFQETAPEPPSPYQQLPLIGSIKRPVMKHQTPQQPPKQQQQPQQELNMKTQQALSSYQQSLASNANQMTRPQSNPLQHQSHYHEPTSINMSGEQQTQELLVSTNIRFPPNEEQFEEASSSPVMTGPPAAPQINGHAQPLSLQQIQQSNPVVFPKTDEGSLQNSPVTPPNEFPYQTDVQIQQHQVVTLNQHKQKLNFPQSLANPSSASATHHVPSQHMEPPPRFPPVLQAGAPETSELQNLHPQAGPHTPTHKYNEFTRKPIPGITRPNNDRNLPNILPQFRPNAKISSGHPSSYNQEPGNIRITANQPPKRPPLNSSPQFAHRHQPMPQTNHPPRYPMKRISEYPTATANRRVYRPPYGGDHPARATDRIYPRRPLSNGIAPHTDGYAIERHAIPPAMSLEKLAAFEEEDLVMNDPPQPVTPSKEHKFEEEEKLEPVVTLQMLQSQKKNPATLPTSSDESGVGEIQVPKANSDTSIPPTYQNGLYVVYPLHGEAGAGELKVTPSPVIASRTEVASTTGSGEYQNTPFSVLRDQPQEPILMVKNKKPQSLQQQTKQANQQAAKADKFPYLIEKPDPSFTEDAKQSRVPGVLIAPRIMHGAYVTGTAAPIAIAYTPTEPNPYRHHISSHKETASSAVANRYSNVNLASSVIGEIRPADTQTEEGFSNDFGLRDQNYEKDFMAPFYPSVSLGSPTSAPANGWNVLPSSTENAIYHKNLINRADIGGIRGDEDPMTKANKSFELDNFQPELQGGFKPIYPPGYKIESESEEVRLHEGEDSPIALASRMESPPTLGHTISATLATATPSGLSTTPQPKLNPSTNNTTNTEESAQKPAISSSTVDTQVSNQAVTPAVTQPTLQPITSSSTQPTSTITPRPALREKSSFGTSLAALLFGEDEDFEQTEDGEARKDKRVTQAVSGPRSSNVPRSGPRSLKLS